MNQTFLPNLIQPMRDIGEDSNLILEVQIIIRNVLAERILGTRHDQDVHAVMFTTVQHGHDVGQVGGSPDHELTLSTWFDRDELGHRALDAVPPRLSHRSIPTSIELVANFPRMLLKLHRHHG